MKERSFRFWRGSRRRHRGADEPPYLCVVDPGSTSLRVLAVEGAAEGVTVWGWDEHASAPRSSPKGFEATLGRAEGMAHDRSGKWLVTDQMVVGLPASQLRGWAWPVTQQRSRPEQPVEERELEALLGRGLRLALNRLRAAGEPEWALVEAVPASLTVDGRGVTDLVGFRAQEIGVTVFAALAPAEIIEGWRQVAEALNFATLTITAAPLALASCLPDPQGVAVDVGGLATNVTWWQAARPVAIDSFPVGGSSLTQALIERWGLPEDRAEALKQAYAAGRLVGDTQAQVQEAMGPAVRTWYQQIEAILAEMNERADEMLPDRLFVCGGGSILPELFEAARTLIYSERLRFERSPDVKALRPTDVPGVANRTERGNEAGDVSALALAAWAGRQGEAADRPARILSRLCGS